MQGFDELVRVLLSKDERRPDLQNVAIAAGRADQDAAPTHAFDDLLSRVAIGFNRRGLDDFDADGETDLANVPDDGALARDLTESGREIVARRRGVLHDALVVHDVKHGE